MKGRYQPIPLLHQHRITIVTCKHFDRGSHAPDNGRANKHGFQFPGRRALVKLRVGVNLDHATIDLPAICVALDSDIHHAKALLCRARNFISHQDGARACAEHGLTAAEFGERREEARFIREELEHGGAFTSGNHQAIEPFELLPVTHVDGFGAGALDGRAMRRKITLQREHPDLLHYQPRVCMSSPSGTLEISSPGIASPSDRLASRSFSGLSKFLAALTIACARAEGSDDLKIPDPTNTASAPSCITSAAS